MTELRYIALPTEAVRALQAGAEDANGQPAERAVSNGPANPCRHCLREIAAGEEMLILAYRPFPEPQPYAELGPIFLHAEPCRRYAPSPEVPAMFLDWESLLVRGYGDDDRIKYGTGGIVRTRDLQSHCAALLADSSVSYLHLRSALNNCYQCRVERV